MTDLTIIGLGLMGTALAETIQSAGHSLTVWNRSPEKMQPFIDQGAEPAEDPGAAIAASPLVLVCIDNYEASDRLLQATEIAPLLHGKTLLQLSTGTPRETVETANWMKQQSVAYLDGAILCGPPQIGTKEGLILLAGDESGYVQASSVLDCLGDVRYLGDNVRAASVLDLAWLCERYGQFLAIAHAARICESEDVDFSHYPTLFPDNEALRRYANVIAKGEFETATATLGVWRAALAHIQQQGRDAGIDTGFPDFAGDLLDRTIDAGYADHNVMSMVKVLRN